MPGNSLIAVRGYHIRVPDATVCLPARWFGELESAWRKIMRRVLALASVVLLGAVVHADAQSVSASSDSDAQAAIGVGIICNTPEQAGRFVGLRAEGNDPAKAIAAVNAEVHDPRACGVAAVAFMRNQIVATRTMGDRLVQIVRINVVAGFNGSDWQRVSSDLIQYAVIDAEGQSI
jgi:hypothetical protein